MNWRVIRNQCAIPVLSAWIGASGKMAGKWIEA